MIMCLCTLLVHQKNTTMILKQRFENGRTNFIDIGDSFFLVERMSDSFSKIADDYFGNANCSLRENCLSFLIYDKTTEPIYSDWPQWIYSNDGQLFLTLTTPS